MKALGAVVIGAILVFAGAILIQCEASAGMRDDSCDDDWTRTGGAYRSNCFSRGPE